jgi:lysophospholipase L1-like esterase
MRTRFPQPRPATTFALGLTLALFLPKLARSADTNQPHHVKWEPAIRAFEAADKTNPPPQNAIEFIGSSSIRLWTNAPALLPGHKIFNRGFGGSHLEDSVAFADRIVIPYRPKLVVLYAGDNDIAAGKSPEQVFADFKAFVAKVHAALPGTTIVFLSIKPSPSRAKYVEPAKAGNRLIEEFIAGKPKLAYVDVFTPMLNRDGQPRAELFVGDQLHLNEAGYKLWAGILKPVLDKFDPPRADRRWRD